MDVKKLSKVLFFFILLIMIFYLLSILYSYNFPSKIDSKLSGIYIDYKSATRGVSVERIHLDSIDEVNPNLNSTYWFGSSFNNYSPPVYLRVYFPFDIEITSYGSCRRSIRLNSDGKTSVEEEECFSFDARVVEGNILEVIYNDDEVPFEQLKISANIFKSETPDRFVFKSFQIKDNPLPFTESGNFVFQNNNIDYSIKIKRNKYQLELSESNFIPEIRNEITGDFNYERIYWQSKNTPVESILYISDLEKTRFKSLLNLFGVLLLGVFLGFFSTISLNFIIKYLEPKAYLRIVAQEQKISYNLYRITVTLENTGKAPSKFTFLKISTEGIIKNVSKGGTTEITTWGGAIGNFIELTTKNMLPGGRAYVSLEIQGSSKIKITKPETDSKYQLIDTPLKIMIGEEEKNPNL